MSLKKIRYIVNMDGNYIHIPVRGIIAQEDKASSIQLITPIKGSAAVSFTIYDSRDKDLVQYLAPQTYKAQDVLDENDKYYQTTYGWNVYEIEVKQQFIEKISRAHAGRIGVSFTMRQAKEHSPAALNYIGTFGRNRIPESANEGDFIVCEMWNFDWEGKSLTKGDILYWFNDQWNLESVFVPIMNTEKITIPVDPSIYAYVGEDGVDKSELEEVWMTIGNIQDQVFDVLDSGTRIHLTTESMNKNGLTVYTRDQIEIVDRIVENDIIISRNIHTNGFVGMVKYTTALEIVVEYKFTLVGAGGGGMNLVFDTEENLKDWIIGEYEREDLYYPSELFIGQLIFIKESDVPDYWVSKIPVETINDLSIQEADQTFDRTSIGENEPGDKFGIWIDTSEPMGIMGMSYNPNHEYVEDPGPVEQIEEEQVIDPGDVEQIEEEQVIDIGSDEGIELPGGAML